MFTAALETGRKTAILENGGKGSHIGQVLKISGGIGGGGGGGEQSGAIALLGWVYGGAVLRYNGGGGGIRGGAGEWDKRTYTVRQTAVIRARFGGVVKE